MKGPHSPSLPAQAAIATHESGEFTRLIPHAFVQAFLHDLPLKV